MKLTAEQQSAVDSRNENLLLAAAAGSGKTRTLVERVIALLEDNACNVDEMLIVTFTNAAAQEMRSRIHAALMKRLETELDTHKQTELERQIILLGGAQISTFHSFCQSILRRNFARIDLDPKFRPANDDELDILKRDVIEELFEENYAAGTDAFRKFTDEFGGNVNGDNAIHEMILSLHKFSLSMPDPEEWLDKLAAPYDIPADAKLSDTIWFPLIKPHIDAALEKIFAAADEAQRLAAANCITIKVLDDDAAQLTALKTAHGWDELTEKISAFKFDRFSVKGKPDPAVKAAIQALRNEYKSDVIALRENYFTADESKMIADVRELAAPIRELVRVTRAFAEKFSAAKRERGIIDFADMEHLALKIFDAAPDVAAWCRDKFRFIMVDEYQDTNGVQEAIIKKFSRDDNVFLVGDVKQSIYRFRLVDSANFRDKMDNAAFRKINLAKNFRSREQILAAVNEVFKRLMISDATEIVYDDDAALRYGADFAAGENFFDEPPEFFHILPDQNLAGDSKVIEIEMRFIAGKIHELIASGKLIRDGDSYRPIQLRDIVILHRSPKTTAFEILETLKRFGVPAYVPDEKNFFQATEVQIVVSLLNLLDNARQDIPLAAVMLSPIGGFSAQELADIRIAEPDADFFTAVECGGERCKNFLARLNRWRDMARQVSVPELLSNLYRETGYYDSVGMDENGEARQANLRILIDRAADFEATNARGLSRFIEFIGKLKLIGNDMATAATLGENDNVVRVVTIHKSKGLEYPVVFVAGLGKAFNHDEYTRGKIFMHRDLGVGVCRTPPGTSLKVKTLASAAVAKKIREEAVAEELRILYVAMTRAQEKLFLTGVTSKTALDKPKVNALTEVDVLGAGKFMDWLLPLTDEIAPAVKSRLVGMQEVLAVAERSTESAREKISSPPEKLSTPPVNIPAKLSVTELKRRAEEEQNLRDEVLGIRHDDLLTKPDKNFIYRRPSFISAKKLSGAEFGTLMHKVMQSLDIGGDLSTSGIAAQVTELARRQIIEPEHAGQVRAEKIAAFFASDIGQRLINAREFYRELPFSRLIDARSFFPVDEKIFVQGIIDLLFKDASGQWVLLDYKTDRDAADIAERYRVQIELYARAVEALLKITVAEKYLYLLNGGKLVKM